MSRPALPSVTPSPPSASVPRMILSPLLRLLRRLSIPLPSLPTSPAPLILAITAAVQRLDLSTDPQKTLQKLRKHRFTPSNTFPYMFMGTCALFALWLIPSLLLQLFLPTVYITALLIPLTSQFVLPATPVFAWLITFFTARYIPSGHRPNIHVALLPALESVLYGANISDLHTRYTNAFLDVLAWLPYGVLHFALPFIVAALLWVFGPKGAVQYWGRAFGFMNLMGVLTQLVFPCAAPWYEIIHGLTPANYAMPGSPGGLLRIDRVFHSSGYSNTFGAAPLVFGAFPSLHSGCGVMEALFLAHFFPDLKAVYWTYVGILWWSTMYLSHHYLIDLTAGACLSVLMFYLFMPAEFKDVDQIIWDRGAEYEMVSGHPREDVDLDEEIRRLEEGEAEEDGEADREVEGQAVGGPSIEVEAGGAGKGEGRPEPKKKRSVSWGETKVIGEGGV